MRTLRLIAVLAVLAFPAFGSPIPVDFYFTNVACDGGVQSGWICEADPYHTTFLVTDFSKSGYPNVLDMRFSDWDKLNSSTFDSVFNPKTDTFSGQFTGKDSVGILVYMVSGTYSVNLLNDTATVRITNAKLIGSQTTPEPGTWLLMGTGLLLLATLWFGRNRWHFVRS
jgi:hypothetical protein